MIFSRKNLVDLFSTFIQFSDDRVSKWITDLKLQLSINNLLKKEEEKKLTEKFISLFLYQQWCNQAPTLAKYHLIAYLQEPCYWASQNLVNKFPHLDYKLSDCFQMAIARSEQVLTTYNVDYGSSLSSFAKLGFRTIINNFFRQKSATDVCTDWLLLRKTSKKRLIASLENSGFNQTKIEQYCLILMCYQAIYTPKQQKTAQKLLAPNTDILLKIISAYQQQAINYPQLPKGKNQITPQSIEKILLQSAKLIREYLYPKTTSLNVTPTGHDSGELLDIVTDDDLSPLQKAINIEEVDSREQNYSQINNVLTEALKNLNSEFQDIFQLYYQENLTQQDIAKKLAIKQYTISRRITRGRELLLTSLIKWSQDNLKITVDTNQIKTMSNILEEWMINYYQNQ